MHSVSAPLLKPEPTGALPVPHLATATGRIVAIDGMRALAMLMVFLYHTWQFGGSPALRLGPLSIGSVLQGFPAGVDLFMVLSGFCLFWPLARKPCHSDAWRVRDYAQRRARRIVPPYVASIVYVSLLPNLLVGLLKLRHLPARWQNLPSPWQYATHLTFTHTLFPSTWAGIQGVYWSLGLEAQFYLVFPLVVWLFRRCGIRVVVPMIVVSVTYRVIAAWLFRGAPWVTQFLLSITFLGRWMEFAAGMTAAWIVARRVTSPLCGFHGTVMLLASVVACGLALSKPVAAAGFFPARELLLSIAFLVAAVALCASQTIMRRVFTHRAVVFLGLISYSIFLLHQNTLYYFGDLLKRLLRVDDGARFGVLVTLGFPMIVAFSYVFFLLFERPFLSRNDGRPRNPVIAAAEEPAP